MVWYKLKIGNYEVKYTPLSAEIKEYPYCDKDGNIIKKVIPTKTEEQKTFYVDEKGNKHNIAFRLIKGKARAKLDKTKEINNFLEVKEIEVEDLLTEKFYICNSPLLLEKLKEEKKALKFAFTNGNGFKVFMGYLHTSKLYEDVLFMSLGQTQKSILIQNVLSQLENQKEKKSIEVVIMGVNKATTEELLEITQ